MPHAACLWDATEKRRADPHLWHKQHVLRLTRRLWLQGLAFATSGAALASPQPATLGVNVLRGSTTLLSVGGRLVLVDPHFGATLDAPHLVFSDAAKAPDAARMPRLDVIAVTSAEPDVFSPRAPLALFSPQTEQAVCVVPNAWVANLFRHAGFRWVIVAAPHATLPIHDVVVHCTPVARALGAGLGYVFRCGGRAVAHLGMCAVVDERLVEFARTAPVDALCCPTTGDSLVGVPLRVGTADALALAGRMGARYAVALAEDVASRWPTGSGDVARPRPANAPALMTPPLGAWVWM